MTEQHHKPRDAVLTNFLTTHKTLDKSAHRLYTVRYEDLCM